MLSGRSGTGPYEIATASGYAVGAAHLGRPPFDEVRLSLPNQRARSVGVAFGRPQAHTAWPCLRGRFFSAVGATLAVARKPSPGGRLPLSRGRFPLSGGNGRRPKGVGMMSSVARQRGWGIAPPAGRSGTGPYEKPNPFRSRRPSEPHLSPTTTKARFQPGGETPKGYRKLSGSGDRTGTSQLSHPRLCVDCPRRLIGGPRKWGS